MDPPLHYVPTPLLDKIEVKRGATSVSHGFGIGGYVDAKLKTSEFSTGENFTSQGSFDWMGHSVDEGYNAGLMWELANRRHRFHLFAARDEGDDRESGSGDVGNTEYERDTFGFGYGFRKEQNHFSLNYQRTNTGESGVPVLPMDIRFYHADLSNFSYTTRWAEYVVDLFFARKEIEHEMSNYHMRTAPDFDNLPIPDNQKLPPFRGTDRRYAKTVTDGSDIFFKFKRPLVHGSLKWGVESYSDDYGMTVFDPDVSLFYINNLSDISVDKLSVFTEWSGMISPSWELTTGARYTHVRTSSGRVDAFPAVLADRGVINPVTDNVRQLRDRFNASDRSKYDDNIDVAVGLEYYFDKQLKVLMNISRKTRSPDYVERYLWIPLEINPGLGDGSNYVGGPGLDPEISHGLEFGFEWRNAGAYFSPRIYHRRIDDYIQGVNAADASVIAVSNLANGDPSPKKFANVDAEIYGIDAEFGYQFSTDWRLDGLFGLVRGRRRDISDNLFRIMPPKLAFTVTRVFGYGSVGSETVMVDEQDHLACNLLDADNLGGNLDADATPGYMLFNLRASYQLQGEENILLVGGIDNILDPLLS